MNKPETFCTYYNQNICRSCSELEISYPEQIRKKEARLKEALSFLPKLNLQPSIVSDLQEFRNKAKMVVTGTSKNPKVGILGDLNRLTGQELLNCPIHHPQLNAVIAALPAWIEAGNLIPYDIASRSGELKGVILFYSELSRELYLRFVLRSQECIARIRKLIPKMQEQFPELMCISANLQPIPHAILEGRKEIILTEKTFIRHQIADLSLNLSPQAFVQTHSKLATELYQTAAKWIQDVGPKSMLELYCGQGAFSFFAAPFVTKSTGVEINPEAVTSANLTAKRLGLSHLHFVCADASAIANGMSAELILVNPPRRGLGKAGIDLVLSLQPKHLIYSSCSVESLGEDLKKIAPHYQLAKAQIFDLFPHTAHFETLVHLLRQ